jgi:hypothetical protein
MVYKSLEVITLLLSSPLHTILIGLVVHPGLEKIVEHLRALRAPRLEIRALPILMTTITTDSAVPTIVLHVSSKHLPYLQV